MQSKFNGMMPAGPLLGKPYSVKSDLFYFNRPENLTNG